VQHSLLLLDLFPKADFLSYFHFTVMGKHVLKLKVTLLKTYPFRMPIPDLSGDLWGHPKWPTEAVEVIDATFGHSLFPIEQRVHTLILCR
jgi:hypothetical protein